MKSNFVVIIRNMARDLEKVCKLCKNNPNIEWHDGFASVTGHFDEKQIKKYEHYDLSVQTDWRSKVNAQDKLPED